MISKELQVKSINQLNELLNEKRESLRAMRFKVSQRQLKKVHDVKNTKQEVAQILTLIKQKQLAAKQ